jgi:hypothetical protein
METAREVRMGRKVLSGSLFVAISVSILGAWTPAHADGPDRVVVPIDTTLVDDTSCDFPFVEEFTGRLVFLDFRDDAGNLVERKVHVEARGTITNPATGETVPVQEILNAFLDFEEGTRTWAGMRLKVTIPGVGAAILDVGRVIFDSSGNILFEAGPHQLLHEDFDDFCDALRS